MKAVALDLDGTLGDTRPLWHDWLESAARLLDVDVGALAEDRGEAAAALDAAGAGNWRVLLERYAEERAPVYLRPNAEASAALRRLEAARVPVGAFTDAPEPLARVAVAQLGAARRLAAVESGADALARLLVRLGPDARVVLSREDLLGLP